MSKKRKAILKVPKMPRNRIAQHPLLKKGGAHQKTNKSMRALHKQVLRSQVRNTCEVRFPVAVKFG